MYVHWGKCSTAWCSLNTVNLGNNHFDNMRGVYVIWHSGSNPRTVRVGQGFIRDRLQAHRRDPQIQHYQSLGLYVTWASIPRDSRNGVEAYLAQTLDPIAGEQFPDVTPIPVNLPWS
jgi:hypothetical protein